jgi:hypothetical protein
MKEETKKTTPYIQESKGTKESFGYFLFSLPVGGLADD